MKIIQATSSAKKSAQLNSFLSKTYHMVNEQSDPTIISWADGGESFVIHNVDAFEKSILPLYFTHSKFTSFIRQLNFYGFKKLRKDPFKRVESTSIRFSHPYFRKDQVDLLFKIKRTTDPSLKQQKSKENLNNENEQQEKKIESLKNEISMIRQEMETNKYDMEQQLSVMRKQLEMYQVEQSTISKAYENVLLLAALQNHNNQSLVSSSQYNNCGSFFPPSSSPLSFPSSSSPTIASSALLSLSGRVSPRL